MRRICWNFSLGKNCFYCLGEACKVISAGNEDILEFGTFIFAYPHTENVFPAVQINADGDIDGLLYNLFFDAGRILSVIRLTVVSETSTP